MAKNIWKQSDNNLDIEAINALLKSRNIHVYGFCNNSKASESYVKVKFDFDEEPSFETVVPYVYRRNNLQLLTNSEIVNYLLSIKNYFKKAQREKWVLEQKEVWNRKLEKVKDHTRLVTYHFFMVLLSLKEEDKDFPANNNSQARFKDIKNMGYTVCIYPIGNRRWGKILLPLPLNAEMQYETFTPQFKSRVIRLFNGVNAYEAKQTAAVALIPDHKFSEVRWDEDTKVENPMTMTDEEIIAKFQLLDNQRNQEKREICRNCVQTGQRGKLFGIDFYPVGADKWDENIPKRGKRAEKGCEGCPWYDIEAWRKAVNEKLKKQ